MYTCDCGKEFETHRQLNGHKSVHREGGRYSVNRAKLDTVYHSCLNCKVEFVHSRQSTNKYCSNACQKVFETSEKIRIWLDTGKISAIGFPKWAKDKLREIKGNYCAECNIDEWNGKPLSLECDHTDGNPYHNHIDNLRLLCPNCHSQTSTFKAKNKGNGRTHRYNNMPS